MTKIVKLSAVAFFMIAGWNLLPPASVAAVTLTPPVEPGSVVVLLPVQNRAGDPKTAADLEQILRFEISRTASVLESSGIRSILRQRRVRNIDSLTPESLAALADELKADWILSATLHGSDDRQIPWLTVSARAYRGSDGEMGWAGFDGGSGMDKPGALQTGVITDMAVLIPRVVRRLTAGLLRHPEARTPTEIPRAPLGSMKLAVFPFEGLQSRDATVAAETVTECARATAYELGPRRD